MVRSGVNELSQWFAGIRADVVYVVAHGFPPDEGKSPILGPSTDRSNAWLTPLDLAHALTVGHTQLVVLRTCDGATNLASGDGWSFAGELHRLGVPIVVAFDAPLLMADSGDFIVTLHDGLLEAASHGDPVDAAITTARRAFRETRGGRTTNVVTYLHPDHDGRILRELRNPERR